MKKIILLIIILVSLNTLFPQTLTRSDIDLIEEMLQRCDLELNSLNFLKDWSGGTQFKMDKVVEILNNPLEYQKFVDKLAEDIQTENQINLLADVIPVIIEKDEEFFISEVTGSKDTAIKKLYKDNREHLEKKYYTSVAGTDGLFEYVELVWTMTRVYYNYAFKECSEQELSLWNCLSTSMWSEPEDSLQYNAYYEKYGIVEPEEVETDSLISMIKKVNLTALLAGAVVNKAGFDILIDDLAKREFEVKEAEEYQSGFGLMRIGTNGADLTDKNYVFSFDPEGNDSYLGRMETSWQQPFFWHIDLCGDDYYHNSEVAGLFSIKGGIGLFADLEGDDIYSGSDYSISSFWGYSEFLDKAGNDVYSFGLHSAGAATFGISLLVDNSGNDSYRVTQYGQGFASTLAFGAVIDRDGFDNYYAGGKYLHVPLAPLDYRSLSQGFGFGMRPDLAGGIGMIYDHSGNDNYTGGVYSQAVAYWYALGIIYDREGYDYYDSVYYPQGSGIHLAGGFLYDGAGEDHYYSKHGPGQGAAHDWAVGFLIDRSGDDHYSVEGGNGVALTNSVTIFLDGSGNDNYQRKRKDNYGYSRPARGTGGIGLFIDTGGKDNYPVENCANDSFWSRGYYGIGLDTLLVEEEKEVAKLNEEQAAEVDSLAAIDEIWSLAAGWAVGSNQETVKRAGEVLVSRAEEAAEYIGKEQLNTKSGLALRAISNFHKETDELLPYLKRELASEDSITAKNCIRLIAEKADSTDIELFVPFLEQDKYTRSVLGALGDIDCRESVIILKDYILDNDEKTRYITAASLKALKRKDAEQLFLQMENDESFLIQTMVKMHKDKLKKEKEND